MKKEFDYRAVVNSSFKRDPVSNELIEVSSCFTLKATDDVDALIKARKKLYSHGIKERKFQGVVRLNQNG